MDANFWIQTSSPIPISCFGAMAEDLSDAIEQIFPLETEDAFLIWNGIYIPMSYKYDVSAIIDDILSLLACIANFEVGAKIVNWGSDTFSGEWDSKWSNGSIKIRSTWNTVAACKGALRASPDLDVSINGFRAEWNCLFAEIANAIQFSQIKIKDTGSYELMMSLKSDCFQFGRLYKDSKRFNSY